MLPRLAALVLLSVTTTQPPPPRVVAALPVPSGELALVTERVIIFKDGHGLFVKSARGVADADGKVHTEQVPDAAVLGTFWAVSETRPLKSTVAGWYDTVRPKTDEGSCLSTVELLRANEGKQLTLGLGEKELQGKVLDVLEAPASRPPTRPDAEVELIPRGGEFVVVELPDRSRHVMPVSSVKTLTGKELSTHCLRQREVATHTKRLTFDFGKEAAGKTVALKIFYFTPGVRWIPTYRVNTGQSSSKADVELQGEILNEEEDFVNAAVDLVVGVPSFKFKGTVSPLSLEQSLRSTLQQAMPQLSNLSVSNAMFNSRAGERFSNDESAPPTSSVMSIASELGAETKQDLFVYPVKGLGLAKGARAIVKLWQHQVPQRHVYTVDLGTPPPSGSMLKLTENKVWHQLELTDTTDVPFTTGAALLMEDGIPLGQDLLGYTPPGGKTMVPITTAINLRALQAEEELSRVPNAQAFNGSYYALVQKKGSIALSNHQKEAVTLRVSLVTEGKVQKTTHAGTVALSDLDRVNQRSTVRWELSLAPGQSLTLGYELSVFR